MKKISELNINEYIMLAEEKVGFIGNMEYASTNKYGEYAGQFEILAFEHAAEPHFTYSFWKYEEEETPNGAVLGYFFIRLFDTKFYNNKTIKAEVHAYVQNEEGANSRLFISTKNEDTGKYLKAYQFPILNW